MGGYSYAGLYRVDDYWPDIGEDGFLIWRFRLVPLEDPLKPGRVGERPEGYESAPRRESSISRVVRDTAVTRQVKRLYDFCCQVCSEQLDTPVGPYAEAAHVRPLGRPHEGPDMLENVLCLCPNHHVQFDRWQFALTDSLTLIGIYGQLHMHPRHRLGMEYIRYHRARFEAAAAA